jgi:hypothetical protein
MRWFHLKVSLDYRTWSRMVDRGQLDELRSWVAKVEAMIEILMEEAK